MEEWNGTIGKWNNGTMEHLDIGHITRFTAAAARTFE
jgi:hypothetical protein